MKLYTYRNKWIVLKQSIHQEGKTHQKSCKGEVKWHVFNTFCLYHQILR